MTTVVISTQPIYPCPAGQYHYPKLRDGQLLKQALSACPDVSLFWELIDPDRDIVGFDVTAVSVDAVKAVVEQAFGKGHGLQVYNPYANWPLKRDIESPKP